MLHGPNRNMVLRHQHGLNWLTRTWASSWPSIVTKAMDINIDPGSFRTIDPDMFLGISSFGSVDFFSQPIL